MAHRASNLLKRKLDAAQERMPRRAARNSDARKAKQSKKRNGFAFDLLLDHASRLQLIILFHS